MRSKFIVMSLLMWTVRGRKAKGCPTIHFSLIWYPQTQLSNSSSIAQTAEVVLREQNNYSYKWLWSQSDSDRQFYPHQSAGKTRSPN